MECLEELTRVFRDVWQSTIRWTIPRTTSTIMWMRLSSSSIRSPHDVDDYLDEGPVYPLPQHNRRSNQAISYLKTNFNQDLVIVISGLSLLHYVPHAVRSILRPIVSRSDRLGMFFGLVTGFPRDWNMKSDTINNKEGMSYRYMYVEEGDFTIHRNTRIN